MSARNYAPSLALVLAHEGGYVNNPRDPGGPTNKGITQRVYDAYRHNRSLKLQSVRLITASELTQIYQTNYWRLIRGDSLPDGVDYAVFDFAVNSGVSRAISYLQKLVGVKPDSVIGDITLQAVLTQCKKDNCVGLIGSYCNERLDYCKSLPIFTEFGQGWTNRIMGLQLGIQDEDIGVVDYATKLAKKKPIYVLPIPLHLSAKALP